MAVGVRGRRSRAWQAPGWGGAALWCPLQPRALGEVAARARSLERRWRGRGARRCPARTLFRRAGRLGQPWDPGGWSGARRGRAAFPWVGGTEPEQACWDFCPPPSPTPCTPGRRRRAEPVGMAPAAPLPRAPVRVSGGLDPAGAVRSGTRWNSAPHSLLTGPLLLARTHACWLWAQAAFAAAGGGVKKPRELPAQPRAACLPSLPHPGASLGCWSIWEGGAQA